MNNVDSLNMGNVNKICNFFAGEAHFYTSVLTHLADKVQSGARLILFSDKELREKLDILIPKIHNKYDFNKWLKNTVTYPLEAIKEIDNREYFCKHFKNMLELLSMNCSEEGVIICVQKANEIPDEHLKKLEELTSSLPARVNIVNCYEFFIDTNKTKSILSKNEFILNTTGVNKIGEIYPDNILRVLA